MTRRTVLGGLLLGALAVVATVAGSRVARSHDRAETPSASVSEVPASLAATSASAVGLPVAPIDPSASASTPMATASAAVANARAPIAVNDAKTNGNQDPAPVASAPSASSSSSSSTHSDDGANGFGTTATAPANAAPRASSSGSHTWQRSGDEFKVAITDGNVDVTAPTPFHTGAQAPVLLVAGRAYRSSIYRTPTTIRFTDVGPVSSHDDLSIAYGNGRPILLRRGDSP